MCFSRKRLSVFSCTRSSSAFTLVLMSPTRPRSTVVRRPICFGFLSIWTFFTSPPGRNSENGKSVPSSGLEWRQLVQGGVHGHAADQLSVDGQMTADGTTGILTVSQHAELTRTQPAGHGLNHFQSELRARSILL